MSTQKSPQYQSRAPKLSEPRERVLVYLPKSEIEELDQLAKQTNRSRSSIIGERYTAGKAQEQHS
ncbi:ribbon-helix-helix domain-containing protein [Acinetobacter ursingii]|jgi:metal-responsive CopG/Arc/MetJ family transcriptional regulator|uniref:ribbon-helix-helix domain-containing protein n=1 Tax=Acinetobacter ursingii TaxID=108980 RepID=UPI00124D476A|nr:ribbon-helix-helix domain-containing protein [Acinetobacter ursingii]MDG9860982.1 ribbon-helix-helix domain-containing protein [Acinetobacter ursingii]MDG9892236.1 ribbon-helix-helix domain-containing protein [Acinetobacter ursingii]MDH0005949.1 ribbon-helix-helix domain-containing protein [Acinetobacter ursingii]MDH0477487.1 ribbon-helix-helix domain-containing protein [Acinetobacter ursingii]MDH2118326.1 ribbon-helix-helix domain-containing protein [Acinetobacter ursingii]